MADVSSAQTAQLMDEAGFLAQWQAHGLHARAPRDAAYEGGLLADQLAWVFVAGYQAAMRSVFPEVHSEGWLAFAVSEDREHPEQYPPLTAQADESEWLLSGCKSWVAQSAQVSELVVSARLRERTELFRVASNIKGLTLSHRPEPGFLSAMSQGFARFDDSPAARLDEPERRKWFMNAEALAMMLAASGYLKRVTPAENAAGQAAVQAMGACVPRLGDLLEALAAGEPPAADELLSLDERWHTGLEQWLAAVETAAIPAFEADRSLLTLYRAAIRKQAQRAAITVSEQP
ncbi:MAG: hypothetical protein AB8B93_03110 [Pseudomonadales bacterium]